MQISVSHEPDRRVFEGLGQYNNQFEPKVGWQPVSFYAEDNGEFLGGIEGYTAWDAMEISNMLVLKPRQGIGRALIAKAEEYAKSKGVSKITAWTLDFQAPEFYKKCGFESFAVVPDFAGKHACHYFIKRL